MVGVQLLLLSQYLISCSGRAGPKFSHIVQTRAKNGKVKHFMVELDKLQLQQEDRKVKEAPIEFGSDYQDDSVVIQKDPRETLIDMIKEGNGTGFDYQDSGPCELCGKISASALISWLVSNKPLHELRDWGGKKINFCKPQSLISWQKQNGIKQEINPGNECKMQLVDRVPEDHHPISWEEWDEKVTKMTKKEGWEDFPKDAIPPNMGGPFKVGQSMLADLLLEEKNLQRYLTILVFLKEHPKINRLMLQWASVGSDLQGSMTARILPSQWEVDKSTFFPDKKTGSDYENTGILYLDDARNYTVDPDTSYTNDREESAWDYYREDPLYHVYHTLLHQVYNFTYPRNRDTERFFYAHDQMIRRGEVERRTLGLPDLVPLGPVAMGQGMGPGFNLGYWAWNDLTSRPDDCRTDQENVTKLVRSGEGLKNSRMPTFQDFMLNLKHSGYHEDGHLAVGYCRDRNNQQTNNPMTYAQVSARDPLFWRWHKHVSNFIREITNSIMPEYSLSDFPLSDGVTVEEVFTTGASLQRNNLETFFEPVQLQIAEGSLISYRRLNHKDFTFNIRIRNPQGIQKKVIVRIFLGESKDGSIDHRGMMEMDRFVTNLNGESSQEIQRRSKDNHQTMKESGMTVNRMAEMIQRHLRRESTTETETFCGLPHHLYLPRSKTGQGEDFELLAFVNDVAQDVTEGSDGIEHMMCGHKYESIVMDDRHYGFPFDRDIDFNLESLKQRVFAQTTVKIVHEGQSTEVGTTETPNPCDNSVDDQEQQIIDELLGRKNLGRDSDNLGTNNPDCQTTKNPGSHTTKYPGSHTTNNPDYSTNAYVTEKTTKHKTTNPEHYTDDKIEITTKYFSNKGQRGHVPKYKNKPKQYVRPQDKYESQVSEQGNAQKGYSSSGKPPKGYKSKALKNYESNGYVHENEATYKPKTTTKRRGPKRYSRKRH